MEGLQRFREVGGRVEASRIPDRKPAIRTFFLDDAENIWVIPELPEAATGTRLDRFDETGRRRGHVDLPIRLVTSPTPVVRNNRLYGVEHDDFGVPYVVVFRLSLS